MDHVNPKGMVTGGPNKNAWVTPAGPQGPGSQNAGNGWGMPAPAQVFKSESTELDDDADIWSVYQTVASGCDTALVESWKGTIDILIIFAGLFSAVVSAFVVDAAKDLRAPQPTTSIETPTSSDRTIALWVNGLWFISLTLSLVVALICVVARQWVSNYISQHPGNSRQVALVRQIRYTGINDWGFPIIIGLLPQLLAASHLIFFAGVVVFLFPLAPTISIAVAIIIGLTSILYGLSTILPIFFPRCPYRTTITNLIYNCFHRLAIFPSVFSAPTLTHKELEITLDFRGHISAATALDWLYSYTTDSEIHTKIYEALAGFGRVAATLSEAEQDLLPIIHDITTQLFRRPNVVFGLFFRIVRTHARDPGWIVTEQGQRMKRACSFFFGHDNRLSERLLGHINSPECIVEDFSNTVEAVLDLTGIKASNKGPIRWADISQGKSSNVWANPYTGGDHSTRPWPQPAQQYYPPAPIPGRPPAGAPFTQKPNIKPTVPLEPPTSMNVWAPSYKPYNQATRRHDQAMAPARNREVLRPYDPPAQQ